MINLKGMHYPKHIILFAVFFYVRYGVSYRDLENIMQERGVNAPYSLILSANAIWIAISGLIPRFAMLCK